MKIFKMFLIFKVEGFLEWFMEVWHAFFILGSLILGMIFGGLYMPCNLVSDRVGYGIICGLALVALVYGCWGLVLLIKFIAEKIKDNWRAAKGAVEFEKKVKGAVCPKCSTALVFCRDRRMLYGICPLCCKGHDPDMLWRDRVMSTHV